jgi:hypothetical protein
MEHLGFTKVYNKEIVLNKTIDDKNIRLIRGSYRSLYIVDINDLTELDKNSEYIRSLNTDHTIWYCPFLLNYYHINNNIIYPYLDIKTNEELLKETIKIISCNSIKYTNPNNINQSNFIIKINKLYGSGATYYITYYITCLIQGNIYNKKKL